MCGVRAFQTILGRWDRFMHQKFFLLSYGKTPEIKQYNGSSLFRPIPDLKAPIWTFTVKDPGATLERCSAFPSKNQVTVEVVIVNGDGKGHFNSSAKRKRQTWVFILMESSHAINSSIPIFLGLWNCTWVAMRRNFISPKSSCIKLRVAKNPSMSKQCSGLCTQAQAKRRLEFDAHKLGPEIANLLRFVASFDSLMPKDIFRSWTGIAFANWKRNGEHKIAEIYCLGILHGRLGNAAVGR